MHQCDDCAQLSRVLFRNQTLPAHHSCHRDVDEEGGAIYSVSWRRAGHGKAAILVSDAQQTVYDYSVAAAGHTTHFLAMDTALNHLTRVLALLYDLE